MHSYDYANRSGVRDISWADFTALAGQMAEGLAAHGVEAVVGALRLQVQDDDT